MKLAQLLSDLVSLQACEHEAAMNLVNATTTSTQSRTGGSSSDERPDLSRSLSGLADGDAQASPDLQRALDLVDLHYGVKERYVREGGNAGLEKARADVNRVLKDLK